MPGGGARVQNLGHLLNVLLILLHNVFFFFLGPYLNITLIVMHSYFDHRYPVGLIFISWHQTPGVGLEVKI